MAGTLERIDHHAPRHLADRLRTWLFEAPLWQLCAATMAVSFLLFGPAPAPNIHALSAVSEDPWRQTIATNGWLYSSPIGPFIYWATGLTSPRQIALLGIVINTGGLIGTAYLVDRYRGSFAARLVVIAFACSPLANLAASWLGFYDVFTIAAATALVVAPLSVCLVAALVLGFNHFEQGVFIVAFALVLRQTVLGERVRPFVPVVVCALLVGRLGLLAYHVSTGIDAGGSRLEFVNETGVGGFVESATSDVPTVLFSTFALLWVPLVWWWRQLDAAGARSVALCYALSMAATFITWDMTRVSALLTWPIVVVAAVVFAQQYRDMARRWSPALIVAALVVPRVMVWYQGSYVSSWGRVRGYWF